MDTRVQELRELKLRQLATMQAALRYWQREGLLSGGHEQDVATDGGMLTALTTEEIDDLCEELNLAEQPQPVVVVSMSGGAIYEAVANVPGARVILLDEDTEGADEDRLVAVNGQDVYVHDFDTTKPSEVRVDSSYVQDVVSQVQVLR